MISFPAQYVVGVGVAVEIDRDDPLIHDTGRVARVQRRRRHILGPSNGVTCATCVSDQRGLQSARCSEVRRCREGDSRLWNGGQVGMAAPGVRIAELTLDELVSQEHNT